MIDFRPRIVIIEPVTELRQGYSLILSSNNKYNIVNTYAQPVEAIANIRKDYPDIIITDLILDGLNGIENSVDNYLAQGFNINVKLFSQIKIIFWVLTTEDYFFRSLCYLLRNHLPGKFDSFGRTDI